MVGFPAGNSPGETVEGPTQACLTEEQILEFLEPSTAGARADSEEHLERCPECRSVVAAVTRSMAPSEIEPGTAFGRYALVSVLGRGAMGTVYRAHDTTLGRHIALKIVHSDLMHTPRALARVHFEGRALAKLSHPNVVTVFDVGVIEGRFYIAMELIEGLSIDAWTKAAKRSVDEVLRAFRDAGKGLSAAHEAGIVHRDFKPQNVLIRDDGRTLVADFGLASSSAVAGLSATGERIGTPAYMAPEQLAGKRADARSDQFAFCVALSEALWGVRPVIGAREGESQVAIERQEPAIPVETRRVPSHVRAALARGLRPDPDERWPSMAPLLAQLEGAPGRRKHLAILALVFTTIVALGLATQWRRIQLHLRLADATAALRAGRCPMAASTLADLDLARAGDSTADIEFLRALALLCTDHPLAADAIERARLERLPPVRQASLEVAADLASNRPVSALASAERELHTFPNDEYLLALGMEAAFHSGNPALGTQLYERLAAVAPDWAMGLFHVSEYASARGDVRVLESLASHQAFRAIPGASSVLPLPLIANRKYRDAFALATSMRNPNVNGSEEAYLNILRYRLAPLAGRAVEVRPELVALQDTSQALQALGFAELVGDASLAAQSRSSLAGRITRLEGNQRTLGLAEWALIDLPQRRDLDAHLARLDALADSQERGALKARLFLIRELPDREIPSTAASHQNPSFAEFAHAIEAERGENWAAASAAWLRGADALGDDLFLPLARLFAAQNAARLGEHERVIAICRDVARPISVGRWSFVNAMYACQLLTARASLALGDESGARAMLADLSAIRVFAEADDPVLKEALTLGGASGHH